MKIVDPPVYFGLACGDRKLVVTKAERAVLLRAVAILEGAHAVVSDDDMDHQGGNDDVADALCLAPPAIRRLAEEGLPIW